MSKKQILFWFLQVILIALLGALQFVDKDRVEQSIGTRKELYSAIYDYRLIIAIGLGLIVASFAGFKDLYAPYQLAKSYRKTLLETIINELFNGDKQNVRATIFLDCRWIRVCRLYLWNAIRHPRTWWRNPYPPKFGKYVLVHQRAGTENNRSRTYFYYSMTTSQECEGIAGRVRQQEKELVRPNLPDISNIDLDNVDLTNSKSKDTQNLRKYMSLGCIKDLKVLKRLHRRSRHFYGNILYNKNNEPVGVLVIDSIQDEFPFDDVVVTKLDHYTKLLNSTF